jgi:hypothetical protein
MINPKYWSNPIMEHRWGERVSVDIPILLRRHARRSTEARIVNISQSGALIRTNLPLPLLGRVDIHVKGHTLASFVVRIERGGVAAAPCCNLSLVPGRIPAIAPAKGARLVGSGAFKNRRIGNGYSIRGQSTH